MSDWISVEERLPRTVTDTISQSVNVLYASESHGIRIGNYDYSEGQWRDWDAHSDPEDVTHWMPLPAPPTDPDTVEGGE